MFACNSHMIEDRQNNTKEHLAYSKDDSHLHLVRVCEDKLVVGNTPNLTNKRALRIINDNKSKTISYRVKSKWIWLIRCHGFSWKLSHIGLRTTRDHTALTRIATASNSTKWKKEEERHVQFTMQAMHTSLANQTLTCTPQSRVVIL